jgi:hypothetical protein
MTHFMKVAISGKRITTIRHFCMVPLLGLLAACGGSEGGYEVDQVELPVDYTLNLYCEDAGIADSRCILDDPENPYARSLVNNETKFELYDNSPSAKSDFYLWATALARAPIGENQYYTALSLHDLYTQGGSEVARDQAKRAYRSLLDNYYDSLTFFEGSPTLDLLPDVDFSFGEFGSGSQLDGAYSEDEDFTPVFEVVSGFNYGAAMALLSFSGRTDGSGMLAGFAANYTNLVFKYKIKEKLPSDSVWVKFASYGDPQLEMPFDLGVYAEDIEGTTGWKQVTIPLSSFPDLDAYTEFAIHAGFGNEGTFLVTDIAFTGDETGDGLVNDVDDNGFVYLYRSGRQLYSIELRNLVGRNLYSPESQNLLQLYRNQAEAVDAMTEWGYVYDPVAEELERL